MNDLVRWDPFQAIAPFEDNFAVPVLFRSGIARDLGARMRLDLAEDDTAYRLAVELAGVQKEAIQVSVHDNSVAISAELPFAQAHDKETNWLLRERSYGKFSRTIALPEAVDDEASEARYVDGMLYLTLKKKRNLKRLTVH